MMESICPICKKIFIKAAFHIYVDGTDTYCSWTCYNKRQMKQGKKSMAVVMKGEDGNILKVFESAKDAEQKTGFLADGIREACRDGSLYMKRYWEYV